jgi:hypothetical protein
VADREIFNAKLTAQPNGGQPEPFTEAEETDSFMGLMGTAMPGKAG